MIDSIHSEHYCKEIIFKTFTQNLIDGGEGVQKAVVPIIHQVQVFNQNSTHEICFCPLEIINCIYKVIFQDGARPCGLEVHFKPLDKQDPNSASLSFFVFF